MATASITVITPSFNQGYYLEDTLRSVLDQEYPSLEYLVFDGGSTDNSVDIIRKYESRLARWVSRRDRGQSDAINQGLRSATGEIVCWINSDDYLSPGSLQAVANYFAENPQVNWVIGDCELLNDRDQPHDIRRPPHSWTKSQLLAWWPDYWFCQQSTFWRRSLMDTSGYLDENLHFLMDWELWLRFMALCPPGRIDRCLAGYRFHRDAKCVSATNHLLLDELAVHEKICRSSPPDLLASFKAESAERLVVLARDLASRVGNLEEFGLRQLLRESGRRVRSKLLRPRTTANPKAS